jgi:hypothetical protein
MLNDGRLVEDDPDTDRTSSAVRDRHRRSCQFEWHTLAVADGGVEGNEMLHPGSSAEESEWRMILIREAHGHDKSAWTLSTRRRP